MSINTAMGKQDGDYLTITNAWASITITREIYAYDDDQIGTIFRLSGDATASFHTLGYALAHAYQELTKFEKGRA